MVDADAGIARDPLAEEVNLAPAWTRRSTSSVGRDPLGLQATSVRIYRGLVPGITNVTNRLRYYSFYCWVVLAYERHEHADDKNRWRRFIRRAEALYALASYAASTAETGGMAGREWVEKEWPTIEASDQADLTLHDDPKVENYLGAARGNFGQFYIASMIDVGLLAKSRGVPLIGPDGRILARAFEASSGEVAKLMADAVLSGTVSVSDLAPIGQAAGPHVISDESEEMRLLRNFIEGRGGRLGSARCNSAWLLLEYLRRLDGARYDEEGAREAFYNRVMPDGSPFQPRSPILLGWRAYEANELCHSALAALFNGMMATAARFELKPDKLCGSFASEVAREAGAEGMAWGDWASFSGVEDAGKETTLEQSLAGCLDGKEKAKDLRGLTAALRLLATLWARWGRGEEGVLEAVEKLSRVGGCSVAVIAATLNAHSDLPTEEALAAVLRAHVIEAHTSIAARKLLSSGLDTYHFTVSDNLLQDPVTRSYQRTNPRLGNLMRFLEDARLCRDGRLTPPGERFLASHAPD